MITNPLVISIFPPSSYVRLVRLYFDIGHYGSSLLQVFDVAHNLPMIYSMALSAFSLRNTCNVKTISNIRIGKELADMSVEGLRKIPKHLSRDSRCPWHDSNWVSRRCKSDVLSLVRICSVAQWFDEIFTSVLRSTIHNARKDNGKDHKGSRVNRVQGSSDRKIFPRASL
jgi:hypothetical protein